jgi:lysophospholipase L1-like esterase
LARAGRDVQRDDVQRDDVHRDRGQEQTPILMTSPTTSQTIPAPRLRRRLVWLGGLGATAIGAMLLYLYFWYARPVGTGPAGPAVALEKFDFHWTDRPVLLVGIGDSVTAGYGASPGKGFFHRLETNPPDEFIDMQGKSLAKVFPNLTVTNLALSGSTSRECLDVLVPKLKTQDEDTFGVIVMTVGGNDIIHNYGRTPPREGAMYGATLEQARPWIENFKVCLEAIISGIEAKFPAGCVFFIANIYDPTDGVGDAENAGLPAWPEGLQVVAAYNEIIAQAAAKRKNAHLVDMHAAFLGHGIHCRQFWRAHYSAQDPHYWYWENLEDPNDRGYDALRRLFLNAMAQTLPSLLEDGD